MKTISKFLIFIFVMSILVVPAISFAQLGVDTDNGGFIPCGRDVHPEGATETIIDANGEMEVVIIGGTLVNPCEFGHALILINTVVRFILFALVVPIAAIMFAYAGFLMVTSGGSTEKVSQAKNIFTNVVLGLIIAIAAWLIISTILSILGYDGDWIGF